MKPTSTKPHNRINNPSDLGAAQASDFKWSQRRPSAAFLGLTLGLWIMVGGFTPATAQLFDSFETYIDTADMLDEWERGELDETTPTPFGTKSLQNGGPTSGDGSGWSVGRSLIEPLDLSSQDTFEFWVRRDPTSVGPLSFSGSLRDNAGQSCVPANRTMAADTEWHPVVINLAEDCFFVDLKNIIEVDLFMTNRSGGPGDILGNFDDIRGAGLFADDFETGSATSWNLP